MLRQVPKDWSRQIQYLLYRHHRPMVMVQSSTVAGAGQGVFASEDIAPGHAVCLYPGVYTPGLPLDAGLSEGSVYLANELTPSGCLPEHNPYILNLQTTGGYLDGQTLLTNGTGSTISRRLNENPSACGHLVNHSRCQPNVEITSFRWRDIFGKAPMQNDQYFLPNVIRADGSPWYLDGLTSTIILFSTNENANDSMVSLCGGALCSRSRIEKGDELFLDYNLKGPVFPSWAASWYSSSL